MKDPRLGRRYAEALFEAAEEQGVLEEVLEVVRTVLVPLSEDGDFVRFWLSPEVPLQRKEEVIEKTFADFPAPIRQFMGLLLEKKRAGVLFDMMPALFEHYDRKRGVVRAKLTTAVELDDKQAEPFVKLLSKRFRGGVILEREVDPEIVAGFRLSYGDKVIDGSVQRSISELRRRISA